MKEVDLRVTLTILVQDPKTSFQDVLSSILAMNTTQDRRPMILENLLLEDLRPEIFIEHSITPTNPSISTSWPKNMPASKNYVPRPVGPNS